MHEKYSGWKRLQVTKEQIYLDSFQILAYCGILKINLLLTKYFNCFQKALFCHCNGIITPRKQYLPFVSLTLQERFHVFHTLQDCFTHYRTSMCTPAHTHWRYPCGKSNTLMVKWGGGDGLFWMPSPLLKVEGLPNVLQLLTCTEQYFKITGQLKPGCQGSLSCSSQDRNRAVCTSL